MNKEKNIEIISEEFSKKIGNQTYASKEYIEQIIEPVKEMLINRNDDTPEEIVKDLLDETLNQIKVSMQNILNDSKNALIPGYTFEIKVGNIKYKIYGGNFGNNRPLTEDAIFDIASMTKQYTQIVAYNLISDGVFDFDSKVKDLCPYFTDIDDLTIGEITAMKVKFITPSRLDEAKNKEELLNILYKTKVSERCDYNYNDIGMMILKEVMEYQTGLTYEQLIDKYIISKLGLKETFLTLPNNKKNLFTGSANDSYGMVNDPKAVIIDGYSGHAGIKASADDVVKFMQSPYNTAILPKKYQTDIYSGNEEYARAKIGSSKIANPVGLDKSDSPLTASKIGNSAFGSTRTQGEGGIYVLDRKPIIYGSTVLLNPSSVNYDEIKRVEEEINADRKKGAIAKGLEFKPVTITKDYQVNGNDYHLVDSRGFLPFGTSTDKMITKNGETVIRLLFIEEVINKYAKDYDIHYDKTEELKR